MDTTESKAARATAVPADTRGAGPARLLFVDNLRTLLTVLVILFHIMIIYSGVGSWYYREGRQDQVTGLLGGWFIVVNQAFFMGLFLLISAYFVPGSYDRKGPGRFLRDRLIRLGIPLAVYSLILRPLLLYVDPVRSPGPRPPLYRFFTEDYFPHNALLGSGPLWFVETLLIFSGLYLVWRLLVPHPPSAPGTRLQFPSDGRIAAFALLLGVGGFLVRLWHPIDWAFEPLNLQFPFFAQYVALFIVGLAAYRRDWLLGLPADTGRRWLVIGALMVLLFPPLAMVGGSPDLFRGGWHWQAMAYALWESFLCLGLCLGLIHVFRRHVDRQRRLARVLSRSAYATYIIHGPVITGLAYALRGLEIHPLLKWLLVSFVSLPMCFGLGRLARRLPYAERVV